MFSKKEFFVAVGVSLFAGIGIGYSKAREKFAEALLKATTPSVEETKEKKDSD